MKTINAYQLHVEMEKINTTVDCISDTAIANHRIRKSAWIYLIKEKRFFSGMQWIPHVFPFIEQWFRWFPCHWLLNVTLQLIGLCRPANWNESVNFSAVTLIEIRCRAYIAQVSCRLCQIKNEVLRFIELMTRLKSFGWFSWLIFRFFNGRNL